MYRVNIKGGRTLLCKIIYRMTKKRIKVVPGDTVTVEVTPADLTRGRIVFRGEKNQIDEPEGSVVDSAEKSKRR